MCGVSWLIEIECYQQKCRSLNLSQLNLCVSYPFADVLEDRKLAVFASQSCWEEPVRVGAVML